MTSITKQVWDLINEDAVVRRALEKDIISPMALAISLIKTHKLDTTTDAVISAIRRYSEKQPIENKFSLAKKVITGATDLRITSNIMNISIEKSKKNQELLQKVFSLVNYERGELLLVIQGEEAIKMLINEKNKSKVLPLFSKDTVLSVEENLAEITLHLPKSAVTTPGIMAVIATELTMNEVNIYETMSCLPELLFFVKQKDVLKSYKLLSELCNR
jgi:aspartokinase